MKRGWFKLWAGVSALLAVAVAGVWVHSAFRDVWSDYACARDSNGVQRIWTVGSTDGRLVAGIDDSAYQTFGSGFSLEVRPGTKSPWFALHDPSGLGLVGFYVGDQELQGSGERCRILAIPDWFLIVLFLLPQLRWLKKGVPCPGMCPTCGYDLRATPERCPECGTVPGLSHLVR